MSKPAKTGLDEFREVATDVRSISPWIIGGAVAVPLVDVVLQIGPPWPTGIGLVTSALELIVIICAFHFWHRISYRRATRVMLITLACLIVFFGAYLYFSNAYVFSSPSDGQRYVKGFVLREDIVPLIRKDYTAADALAGAQYRPDEVWTSSSITLMQLNLLLLWAISFTALSLFIATFVIYQRRRAVR